MSHDNLYLTTYTDSEFSPHILSIFRYAETNSIEKLRCKIRQEPRLYILSYSSCNDSAKIAMVCL